ncbi:MAG: thioredoxin domain-containing protein [Patescibacteria group bacterium]
MAQFIVHKETEERKRPARKASENGASSFWVPFAIVIAGALIAGAIIFRDQLKPGTIVNKDIELVGSPALTSVPVRPSVAAKVEIPLGDSPFLGEATASVTVTEFMDFQCPACSAYFANVFPQVKAEYIDKGVIKYVAKNFPLRNIHPNAQPASEAAMCANDQKSFPKYHDTLFMKQTDWASMSDPTETFVGYATQLGLNGATFRSCLTGAKAKEQVEKDVQLGIGIGVSGTPTVFVNGILAGQPGFIPTFAQIKELVDQEIKK